MNKTLLLILCDFLLLNLLALTRWEKAEPPRPKQPPVPELAANAVTKDDDLVAAMRASLADEQAVRDELAQKLSSADAALAAREQSLNQIQAERARIAEERNAVAASLTETQRAAADLSKKFSAATQEATITKEQLAQIQSRRTRISPSSCSRPKAWRWCTARPSAYRPASASPTRPRPRSWRTPAIASSASAEASADGWNWARPPSSARASAPPPRRARPHSWSGRGRLTGRARGAPTPGRP
jgi:hypothetical protein